jgi:DNA modification methylase
MGVGTTALACKMLSRKWIGSEISQEYYNISIDRIKDN